MNEELLKDITEANRISGNAEILKKELDRFIFSYHNERRVRINLQFELNELADVAERQRKVLVILRLVSFTSLVLSLISLLR